MKKLLRWIADALLSIGRGDILIKLGVHRYLPHIVVAFAFCTLSIILSYLADNSLIERSLKRKELEDVKITYSIKNNEMISLWRMTMVEETLEKMGSRLEAPSEPAKELKE
ncbi:MAG: FtsL-like putative cell division protein [Candidatus Cryptobacteroides sp.]